MTYYFFFFLHFSLYLTNAYMKYNTFLTIIILVSIVAISVLFYKVRIAMIELDALDLKVTNIEDLE